ncbi:LCP family protein [Faecalispora anaeroviscerum]|uniref:LCP family protein n=1 Tax=Faecalispora anaeroviscerum TaxID=2991836 RepID=UPI0024BA96EE|nr:LCP family protein [Faecalispora anaeroviscerum]
MAREEQEKDMARNEDNRSGRGGSRRPGGEIDRYNYVDRDIYSNSDRDRYSSAGSARKSSPKRRPPKKKKGKKVAVIVLAVVFLLCAGVVVYASSLLSQINRDNTDANSYIQQPSDAPQWDVMSNKQVTNILLLGTDREKDGLRRSDTMMLVSIDNKNKKIKLTSFLRDLYVEIPDIGKNKLNASYSNGGGVLTMQTIENNFRVNIDKYVSIDVDSFAEAIDKMGGIEVNISQAEADEMNRVKDAQMSAGTNHMRGTLALYYSRIRIIDSDFNRTSRQRKVIGCMVDKLKTKNPIELSSLLHDYMDDVTTNLSDMEMLSLVASASGLMNYPIETMHMPESGMYENERISGIGDVLNPDLEANGKALREFIYGTDAQ